MDPFAARAKVEIAQEKEAKKECSELIRKFKAEVINPNSSVFKLITDKIDKKDIRLHSHELPQEFQKLADCVRWHSLKSEIVHPSNHLCINPSYDHDGFNVFYQKHGY